MSFGLFQRNRRVFYKQMLLLQSYIPVDIHQNLGFKKSLIAYPTAVVLLHLAFPLLLSIQDYFNRVLRLFRYFMLHEQPQIISFGDVYFQGWGTINANTNQISISKLIKKSFSAECPFVTSLEMSLDVPCITHLLTHL